MNKADLEAELKRVKAQLKQEQYLSYRMSIMLGWNADQLNRERQHVYASNQDVVKNMLMDDGNTYVLPHGGNILADNDPMQEGITSWWYSSAIPELEAQKGFYISDTKLQNVHTYAFNLVTVKFQKDELTLGSIERMKRDMKEELKRVVALILNTKGVEKVDFYFSKAPRIVEEPGHYYLWLPFYHSQEKLFPNSKKVPVKS